MKNAKSSLSNARALEVDARQKKAALLQRAEELITRALDLRRRITRDFWQLGRVLKEMRDEGLHRTMGYGRFDELVEGRLEMSKSVAWKLIAVATRLPREDAVKLGQEKAYALVAYTEAAPSAGDPSELVRRDAVIGGRPISQSSVRDLAAARPKRPKTLAARGEERADRKLRAALKPRLAGMGLIGANVDVVGDEVRITIRRRAAERLVDEP